MPEHNIVDEPTSRAPDPRVLRDTVCRYLAMSVAMVVSFLLLPFLLRHIGKPAYGLQALAHQTLEFVTILAIAVEMSHDRIAADYYAKGEYNRMNAVLAAGLRLSLVVAVVIVALTALLAWLAPFLFDLPDTLVPPAQAILVIFGIGAALRIVSSVYQAPVYMTQRLYLTSIANMISIFVPTAIVIPLFIYGRPSIVAWVTLSVAARLAAAWTIVIPFARRGIAQLKIGLFAPGANREIGKLAHFGGLTVVGSLGALLYYATDAIMISNLNALGIDHVVNYNVAQRWYPQISITLVKLGGMGLMGIATGSLISLFLLEVICLPTLLCRHLSLDCRVFLHGAGRALLGAIPLVLASLVLPRLWVPTRLTHIVVQFFLCGVAYLPGIWFVSMTHDDRKDLQAALTQSYGDAGRNRR